MPRKARVQTSINKKLCSEKENLLLSVRFVGEFKTVFSVRFVWA